MSERVQFQFRINHVDLNSNFNFHEQDTGKGVGICEEEDQTKAASKKKRQGKVMEGLESLKAAAIEDLPLPDETFKAMYLGFVG